LPFVIELPFIEFLYKIKIASRRKRLDIKFMISTAFLRRHYR
jgi:hypothetical protein